MSRVKTSRQQKLHKFKHVNAAQHFYCDCDAGLINKASYTPVTDTHPPIVTWFTKNSHMHQAITFLVLNQSQRSVALQHPGSAID